MDRCSTCGNFRHELENHKCPPMFFVWCLQYGEERDYVRPVFATSPRGAAEAWAERADRESADYDIISGECVEVLVVSDAPGAPPQRYSVEGYSEPVYSARLLGEDGGR